MAALWTQNLYSVENKVENEEMCIYPLYIGWVRAEKVFTVIGRVKL